MPHKCLALVMEVSPKIVQVAIHQDKQEILPTVKAYKHAKQETPEELVLHLHQYIVECNLEGVPVSLQLVIEHLKTTDFTMPSKTRLNKLLLQNGCNYGIGNCQNILHDLAGPLELRSCYLPL